MFGKKKKKAGTSSAAATSSKASKKADKKAAKAKDETAGAVDLAAAAAIPSSPVGKVGAVVATLANPKSAKKLIAVGKVAGPVIAPFAYKAAAGTREFLDTKRAQRLGVTATEVAAYRGVTGPAEARIDGLSRAIGQLRDRRGGELEVARFVDVATTRLTDLAAATAASATMPTSRRRATLRAIGNDLDQIDRDLMTYLVGTRI
ncbi:hypothetical protein D1871_05055 [Nakamurella silvestris]|nr:hypothetical protein D1871_05055 [Nakamurella silvestris]